MVLTTAPHRRRHRDGRRRRGSAQSAGHGRARLHGLERRGLGGRVRALPRRRRGRAAAWTETYPRCPRTHRRYEGLRRDHRRRAHPGRVSSDRVRIRQWTCVVGELEGGGRMVTVAKWVNGAIAEEYVWI